MPTATLGLEEPLVTLQTDIATLLYLRTLLQRCAVTCDLVTFVGTIAGERNSQSHNISMDVLRLLCRLAATRRRGTHQPFTYGRRTAWYAVAPTPFA